MKLIPSRQTSPARDKKSPDDLCAQRGHTDRVVANDKFNSGLIVRRCTTCGIYIVFNIKTQEEYETWKMPELGKRKT